MLLMSKVCAEPEAFEEHVSCVAAETRARPMGGREFRASVNVAELPNVGFLSVHMAPMQVLMGSPRGFLGLTVALGDPVSIARGRRRRSFDRRDAHLLFPEEPFDLRSHSGGTVLGTNFRVDHLSDQARRLFDSDEMLQRPKGHRLSMATPAGSGLLRCLLFLWGEFRSGGGLLRSEPVARDFEDGLVAALLLAMEEDRSAEHADGSTCADRRLSRAEDYLLGHLCKPISRAMLAEEAGVSIRAVSRGFRKRHGVGPMAFLKQRRLEAARAALLAAEPGHDTVTGIATQYMFADTSKFTAAYKSAFGELPSTTLRR